ncbi:MAG: prepilin-type N-terminal cleavage/methylation domain-containing protein [Deltaproteobacteria bacterium]|nr:prepilin-type N-terminal cleavage/methylation domain-containing protein [Deltaproteobacteria bacterium]
MGRIRTNPNRLLRAASPGFTLVELMVAMAAGLLIATAAFSFSKQATRAFAQEARIASTQMSVLAGFQRLQADVSRASYMSSPNFARDAAFNRICEYNNPGYWPSQLSNLAGLSITVEGSKTAPAVTTLPDGKAPDSVRIVGNLVTAEAFTVLAILPGQSAGHDVYIRTNDGPSTRAGFVGAAGGLFTTVFAPGRILRIVDKQGHQHYSVISANSWSGGQPFISTTLPLPMKGQGANPMCSIDGIGTDTQVNVVNIVDYGITNLSQINKVDYNNTIYSTGTDFSANTAVELTQRTELVRREVLVGQNAAPAFFQDPTAVVVAEYAVDLRFAAWTSNTNVAGCGAPTVGLRYCPYSSPAIAATLMSVAGPYSPGNPATGPESVRSVQMRLVTRSREVDRAADLTPGAPIPPLTNGAIYRVAVGTGWARARTLVADVALPNQRGDAWN